MRRVGFIDMGWIREGWNLEEMIRLCGVEAEVMLWSRSQRGRFSFATSKCVRKVVSFLVVGGLWYSRVLDIRTARLMVFVVRTDLYSGCLMLFRTRTIA